MYFSYGALKKRLKFPVIHPSDAANADHLVQGASGEYREHDEGEQRERVQGQIVKKLVFPENGFSVREKVFGNHILLKIVS